MNGLKKIREERNMTQEELANILSVSRPTVTLWENGINKPRADMLLRLSKILGCTIEDLLCPKT